MSSCNVTKTEHLWCIDMAMPLPIVQMKQACANITVRMCKRINYSTLMGEVILM